MAMKIGGRSRFSEVLPRHWQRFAHEAGLAPPRVRRDLLAMAEALPAEARRLSDELGTVSSPAARSMYERIVADVEARAAHVRSSGAG